MSYPVRLDRRLSTVGPLAALALCCAASAQIAAADERTSQNDPRFAAWLKQYPEADADADGVLTESEARAYRDKLAAERRESEDRRGDHKPIAPTRADERYGPHRRNVLDFYQADSDRPTPVVIYFHGGGFVAGDKAKAAGWPVTRQCLDAGISVVGANYRFVRPWQGEPGAPFPAPMLDGGRVIQFVRSRADEWSIDPERIALAGSSAGACMSIWLALHDDLARTEADDPIARLSTRVRCVIAYGGQTVLDPKTILEHIGGNPGIHPSLEPFFDVSSIDELDLPEKRKMIAEASAINHADPSDPPLQLRYGSRIDDVPLPPTASIGASIHHPMFGKLLQDRYEELNLECQLIHKGKLAEQEELEFLKEQFGLGP